MTRCFNTYREAQAAATFLRMFGHKARIRLESGLWFVSVSKGE